MEMTYEPQFISVSDFAKILNLNSATILRLIYDGELKSLRLGKKHLIPIQEVERILNSWKDDHES
jgi:DNA binding domain, excisionase family